jgi:hypothetical protein
VPVAGIKELSKTKLPENWSLCVKPLLLNGAFTLAFPPLIAPVKVAIMYTSAKAGDCDDKSATEKPRR